MVQFHTGTGITPESPPSHVGGYSFFRELPRSVSQDAFGGAGSLW